MAWTPEQHRPDNDESDSWRGDSETQKRRQAARRRGYDINMDDRQTEREPSRCQRALASGGNCNGVQYLEAVIERQFLPTAITTEYRIPTRWPVAVCRRCGAREEL